MTEKEKLEWCRKHWGRLKREGRLERVIAKIKIHDFTVQEIIDFEECFPEYLNK